MIHSTLLKHIPVIYQHNAYCIVLTLVYMFRPCWATLRLRKSIWKNTVELYTLTIIKNWDPNFSHIKFSYITFTWPYIVTNFLIINQLDALISQNFLYFGEENPHVSDSSSVYYEEFFTVHTAVVYVIQVCWQLASSQQTSMTHTIAVCTVKNSWWWTEELSETCRFSFQNKIEKLVHLIGFIIRKVKL